MNRFFFAMGALAMSVLLIPCDAIAQRGGGRGGGARMGGGGFGGGFGGQALEVAAFAALEDLEAVRG